MRFVIYADPHWCQYSSIVRSRGIKYSTRLENLIQSINWVYKNIADEYICLGDFFDTPDLNAEELTALTEVNMGKFTTFICGNHEMASVDHSISASHLFRLMGNRVVDKPYSRFIEDVEFVFLPYVLESDRKPLAEYLGPREGKRIIFSHNDIAGIQMGMYTSEAGFSIEEIEANCDLFINGHLHNGQKIRPNIINLGNLTGQNFGEDASTYKHGIFVIDVSGSDVKVEFIENPYAFNFYKCECLNDLKHIGGNAVVSVTCSEEEEEAVRDYLKDTSIIESRVAVRRDIKQVDSSVLETFSVDHIAQFQKYMLDNSENTETLISELQEVCR